MLSASALAALAVVGASGCQPQAWPWATPPKPAPDVGVLRDVTAAEDAMIAKYTAVIAAFPSLSGTMAPLLAQHREHLAQLRARLVIPRGASPSESASVNERPQLARPRVPASQSAAAGYLRTAERDEAAALVRWLTGVPPSLAQLLASIGACEATHAALLGPARESAVGYLSGQESTAGYLSGQESAVSGTTATGALQGVLAAENAAIFGYGMAGAFMTGTQRDTATAFWNEHKSAADTLTSMLRARGATPAAAGAAYKMPFAVHDRRQAVALAAYLEDGVAAAYLGVVGASGQATLREFGAVGMQRPAARAAYWRGAAVAFPGLPASAVKSS